MKNEYYTPRLYIDKVKCVLGGIDLDPFSSEYANYFFVNSKVIFTKEVSAYCHSWDMFYKGKVFMNPPYSDGEYKPAIELFLEKLERLKFSSIVLTNNNTDTTTTQKLMSKASAYCFPEKRINYYTKEGQIKGNRYGQLFCYFGKNIKLFRETFNDLGVVTYNPDYLIFGLI
jgi:hypothetical protein